MRLLASSLATLVGLSACVPTASIAYRKPPPGTDRRTGLGMMGNKLAAAMHATYRAAESKREAPLDLVPTDGSELALRSLTAITHIDGPLARTELHLVFHNAEPRIREGRFAITLPAGATVGRFAMKVGAEWREARVVARDKGRQVYETFLHRGVDPALLEKDLGNKFSARVFPIEASADKEIILAYEHGVSTDEPYTLALAGLPPVPSARVTIHHDGKTRTIEVHEEALADVIEPVAPGASAVAADTAFVARVDLPADATTAAPIASLLVLVDTSASRMPVMAAQANLVRDLLARLPAATPVRVAAFDQRVTPLYAGTAAGAKGIAERVLDHGALGASDLGGALAYARTASVERVVLVGDGVPTLGETDAQKLAKTLGRVQRVDAVQVGDSLDRETLQAIVAAGTAPGAILDGRDATRLAAQLQLGLPAERAIHVAGAIASWPATTRGLAPGAPIWVHGLRDGSGELAVHVGERALTVRPVAGDAKRVRRAVASAELAALTERMQRVPEAERLALGTQIEELALAHQLVSAKTSLIVLESDELERRMLGPAETVPVTSTAPMIDPTSTTQGITIERNDIRNIPLPGRTFESALGAAPGAQGDGLGVSFSGSSSLENEYYVDGVNSTGLSYDSPEQGQFRVTADVMSPLAQDLIAESLRGRPQPRGSRGSSSEPKPTYAVPYTGKLATTLKAIDTNRSDEALVAATRWHLESPGEVAAIIALGEALESKGAGELAARAYGSIIDLYPNRAELARAAGERLDRIETARELAIDGYRRALRERPDQISTYRLLAFALLRAGKAEEALEVLHQGQDRSGDGRIQQVLTDDAAVIAAHLAAKPGASVADIELKAYTAVATKPSIRFVLSWETDANDVDLHVYDRHGGHAFFQKPTLASGGALLADITTGYGPEQFSIAEPDAFPYRVRAHYYRKGPMGIGLGTVQIIRHDGKGNVTVEDRPFVIQNDNAMVDLGTVAR
jgi:hypothetical protein